MKTVTEKKRKDGGTLYRINRKTKRGVYNINDDSWQRKWLSSIELHGFEILPSGLFTDGRGLTASGSRLLTQLNEKYGNKLRLCIAGNKVSSVRRDKNINKVTINHDDLRALNNIYRGLRQERNQTLRDLVDAFLHKTFPRVFKGSDQEYSTYTPGTLARILSTPDLVDHLSVSDRKVVQEFLPQFIHEMDFSLRSTSNIAFAKEGLGATQTIYLDKIVEEYEKKLKTKSTENTWQQLLQKHILILLHAYVAVIEKQSIDLDGKYPDFMLVDPYGYIDIYEIKKPQTGILQYDKSRNNYYWSSEVSKALSQVENYIDSTSRHRLELADKIRKKFDLQVKIVRPRGFVIVGMRSQLKSEKMQEDFRILNDSLKNIDIILYDDLLENLKAMLGRFKKSGGKSKKKSNRKASKQINKRNTKKGGRR